MVVPEGAFIKRLFFVMFFVVLPNGDCTSQFIVESTLYEQRVLFSNQYWVGKVDV